MSENLNGGLEAEIADLTRQIEEKKRVLEGQSGIVREDKEILAETVAENFTGGSPVASAGTAPAGTPAGATSPAPVQPVGNDYLATLSPETVEQLNGYISMIPAAGIKKTVAKVKEENPYLLDAFHDALVTRLYDELKQRGIVK